MIHHGHRKDSGARERGGRSPGNPEALKARHVHRLLDQLGKGGILNGEGKLLSFHRSVDAADRCIPVLLGRLTLYFGLVSECPHDRKDVLQSVTCFRDHEVSLGIQAVPLGDVLELYEDVGAVIVRMNKPPRVDQEGPLSDRGEVVGHLVAQDARTLRNDGFEQLPEFRDVPLSVAKHEQRRLKHFVASHLEGLNEGIVRGDDPEALVQYQERPTDGIDDTLCLNMAALEQPIKVF